MSSVPAEPRRPGANPAIVWPCRKRASSLPSRLVANLAKEMQTANIIPRWLVSQTSRVSRPAEPAAADRRMRAAFFSLWIERELRGVSIKQNRPLIPSVQTRDAQVWVPGSREGGFCWSQAYGGVSVFCIHAGLQIDSLQTRPGLQTQRGR